MGMLPNHEQKWPADAVERWPITQIQPYARNARTHSDTQIAQIAASITQWGWTVPLLVDDAGSLIAGHARLAAAQCLGIAEVPVMVARGWTDAQRRAYVLADNKLTLNGGWDNDTLALELGELKTDGFDLGLIGFSGDELAGLLGRTEGLTDPDDVPEPPAEPVTVTGDVWAMGRHRLVCGDCTDADVVESVLAGRVADLIVTSPPYNQHIDGFRPSGMHKEHNWVRKVERLAYADSMPERAYQEWQRELLVLWFSVTRDGASVFYNHKNRYRDKRVVSPLEWLPGPFNYRQEIVWRRPGSVTQNARMFLPCDERIFWLYKGDDFTFSDTTEIKTWSSVWDINPGGDKDHAVAYPTELPLRCIRAASMPDDAVMDPFSGSGTTIIAAEMTGRACNAIEISPQYCDVTVLRWQAFTGQQARNERTGAFFDAIKE